MALFIFLIVMAFNQDILTSTSSQFETTKAKTTLDDIANAAELVYQEGVGAKTKVFVTIPSNVQSTSVSGKTLNINILSSGNPRDVYRTVNFDVQGNIPKNEGNYWVVVESMQNYVKIGEVLPVACGNNVKEGSEQCDGSDLGGATCISLGYLGGTLTCSPTCTFDKSGCLSQICGDNTAQGTEVCDGTDLKGQTCISQGFLGGTLVCKPDCIGFATTGCYTQLCGNNIVEGTEVCDGTDLKGQTCISQGFAGGTLACQPTCNAFDTSGCASQICGNNKREGTEQCDDGDLGGQTCISLGYLGGTLTCSLTCTFDTSSCLSQICGNNIAEGTEVCDGTDLKGQTCISQGFDTGALACQLSCNAFDTSGCKKRKVIFSDNFDTASLNPIWQQPVSEWFRSTDTSPHLTIMESDNTGNVERYVEASISTVGYTSITFKFDYDTDALDSGEYIGVDWYNSATWTNLLQNSQTSWITGTYNLPVSADNNPNFRIRYRCKSNSNNEECKVDTVEVSGLG